MITENCKLFPCRVHFHLPDLPAFHPLCQLLEGTDLEILAAKTNGFLSPDNYLADCGNRILLLSQGEPDPERQNHNDRHLCRKTQIGIFHKT